MAFLVRMLGCGQDTTSYTVLCVLLLRFALPGKGPVCCIGSNVTSLCGVVRLATCLRGWINSFWLPFSSVTVFVIDIVIIVGAVVWNRVIGVTFYFQDYFVYFQFVLVVFSTSDTDSCNVLVFYSGGTLVWVCQH